MQELVRKSYNRLLVAMAVIQVVVYILAFTLLAYHDINTPTGQIAFGGGLYVFGATMIIQLAICEKMTSERKYSTLVMIGAALGAASGLYWVIMGLKQLFG